MIPLRDSIPASRTPVVTWALVAACTAAFLLQLCCDQGELIERYGMVPARVFDPQASHVMRDIVDHRGGSHVLMRAAVPDWLTLLTCTFLHGGWLHFLGNMWFLWIFGDNVEDRFGRLRFLCFYLGCGVAASLAHLLSSPQSSVPTIGASGAIAGVMGAYLFLYPRSRVEMLFIWGFFVDVIVLPAPFFLGYWFLLQLVQGLVEVGSRGGGVAWWAHIGGFAAGAAVAALWGKMRPPPPTIVLTRRRHSWSPRRH